MDILNIKNVSKFVRLNAGIVAVLGNKEIDRFVPYYRVDRHYVVAVITATAEALGFWEKQGTGTYHRDGDKLYIGLSFSSIEPKWFDILTNNQDMTVRGLEWVYPWDEGWYPMDNQKELLMSSKNGYRLGWSADNIPPRPKADVPAPQPVVCEVKVNINDQKVIDKWLNEVCKSLDHYFDYSDDISVFKAGKLAYEKAMELGRSQGINNPESVYRLWLKSK